MLGRTLKVDKTSLRRVEGVEGEITDKARFARLCVEVDLRRSFVSRFRIWDFIQQEFIYLNVGYEGLHMICFACGRYGHRKENCDGGRDFAKEKSKEEEKNIGEQGKTMEVVQSSPEIQVDTTMEEEKVRKEAKVFGAWMVVKRKPKGRRVISVPESGTEMKTEVGARGPTTSQRGGGKPGREAPEKGEEIQSRGTASSSQVGTAIQNIPLKRNDQQLTLLDKAKGQHQRGHSSITANVNKGGVRGGNNKAAETGKRYMKNAALKGESSTAWEKGMACMQGIVSGDVSKP